MPDLEYIAGSSRAALGTLLSFGLQARCTLGSPSVSPKNWCLVASKVRSKVNKNPSAADRDDAFIRKSKEDRSKKSQVP